MLSAGAPARADLIINSFEPSGTAYTAWTTLLTTCAVKVTCPVGDPGPCVTLFRDTTIGREGTASGVVWLQEDTGSGEDCLSGSCGGPVNGQHPVTIQSFAPKDWSSGGFLKLMISGRLPQAGVAVDFGLRVQEGAHVAYGAPVTMSAPGIWYDATANLPDLVGQGVDISKIDQVSVIFPSVSACTSVLIDSLRLTSGTPPCAPNTVSAMAGDSKVTVSWVQPCTGSYGIAQWCVYRATFAIPVPLPMPLPSGMAKLCGFTNGSDDTGRTNGTMYYYKVTAVDTDGNESAPGDALPEQDFATPTCGGAAPSLSGVSWSGGIRLMWSPVPGATEIRIYRAATSGTCASRGPLLSSQPGVSVYYDDKTPTLGQTWCYTVTAVVGGCESPCSNQACVLFNGGGPPPCSPPGPILFLTALAHRTEIVLGWTPAAAGDSAISYYQVWRGNAPGPLSSKVLAAKVFDSGGPVYSWTNTGLPPVTPYCYQVCAVADNSCSNFSAEECATSGCDLVPPAALSSVGWCDRVRISWTGVPAAKYKIYKALLGGACGAVLLDVIPGVSVYYDDKAVTDGDTYAYVVTASGAVCDSVCSVEAVAGFRTTDPCPPTPPCTPPGVVNPPTAVTGTAHLAVTWTRPVEGGSPLSRYFVWIGAGSTGSLAGKSVTATVWDSPGGPVFTATVTGLTVGTSYCAIIEVVDDNGASSCTNFSSEACFTTVCVQPSPPGAVSVFSRPPDSFLVSWAPATPGEVPLSRYLVYRSTAMGGYLTLTGTVWADAGLNLSLTNTGVMLSQDYCYHVLALDEQGCMNWSAAPPSGCHTCVPPAPIAAVDVRARAPDSLLVSWGPPTPGEVGLSRYLVFRASGSGPGWLQTFTGTVYDAGGLNLSYTNTGLTLSQEYCYQVMAVDEAGCARWSAAPGCRTCTPPNPVTPAALSGLPPTAIALGWTRPPAGDTPVSRYLIFRSTAPGTPQAYFGTVYDDGVAQSYTFTNTGGSGMSAGSWCYQILAVDSGGCSSLSPDLCYACAPPQWGIAHEGTASVNAVQINSTNVLVSWDFARPGDTMNRVVTWNPVSRYFVFRSTGASCFFQDICATVWDDQVTAGFSCTVTGLDPATTYSFEIMAVSRNGCATITVDCGGAGTAGACSFTIQPQAWALTGPTGTPAVGLRWAGSSTPTLDGFDILRGTVPTGGSSGKSLVASVGASALSWTDSGVEPGKTYYYVLELKTVGPPPCSVYSAEAGATLPALKLVIYPNPAMPSKTPVRFDGLPPDSTVEIYTLNGELARKSGNGIGALWLWDGKNDNGTPVAPGIYLWIVRTGGSVTRGKVVVGQ